MPLELNNVMLAVNCCKDIMNPSSSGNPVQLPNIIDDITVVKYISHSDKECLLINIMSDDGLNRFVRDTKYFIQTRLKISDYETGFTSDKIINFFRDITHYVGVNTNPSKVTEERILKARGDCYKENPDGVLLGFLCKNNFFMCREKAIMLHLLLAQYGFPSYVVYGRKEVKPGEWHAHEYLVCGGSIADTSPQNYKLDATKPKEWVTIWGSANYEYNNDVMWFRIVSPQKVNPFFKWSDPFETSTAPSVTPKKPSFFDD